MTALPEYDRLEAPGLWRPTPQAQRVEVIVSIGDATLTLADKADRPLAHWSLPAVHRLNPGTRPALFAPSDDANEDEQLELTDNEMIAAIEKVRKVIARRRPREGRVRFALTAVIALTLGTAAITWLPGAVTDQTVALLPDATRQAVGDKLLLRVRRVAGEPCTAALGRTALAKLGRRVLSDDAGRIVIVSSGVSQAAHLPGKVILLNRTLIEDFQEPDVAAGFILAERLRAEAGDPMRDLLETAGLIPTIRMLTTGQVSDAVLDAYAETLLTRPPTVIDQTALLTRFGAVQIRSTPYAYAVDPTGETMLHLIEADPVPVAQAQPILPDADWVSLQGICTD